MYRSTLRLFRSYDPFLKLSLKSQKNTRRTVARHMIRCRMRILLVEDDRKLADYVRRSLEEEHNSVTVCFDGAAGLEEARKENHDAIVLDVMMPVMDGFEVTRRIRADKIRTPILLLTARDA